MNKLTVLLALALAFPQASPAADEWLKDEVLRQLSELRQDNARLRGEVDALKRRLDGAGEGRAGARALPLAELLGGGAVLGGAGAKVVVAEFGDFECPYCRKFGLAAFPEFKRRYIDTGKARYVARDFPLGFHAQARAAAAAARCAGRQDAYWAMRQKLFESQGGLGRELFLRLGAELRLDGDKLQACLDDSAMAGAVGQKERWLRLSY